MRAVTCTDGEFEVKDLAAPTSGRGQLVLDVLRCGICGSDLHARRHGDELAGAAAAAGYDGIVRAGQSVVFGHEFTGEVASRGGRFKLGTRVVALPIVRSGREAQLTGLSPLAPGGYAEQVLVQESLTFAVPNGLPTEQATLTEPMAVGLHAVRRSQISSRQTAVVVGCGPVGLAVIAMLKARGVSTVIASDFSARRRALASAVGADVVIDPAQASPFADAGERGWVTGAQQILDLAISSMDRLRRIPVIPWERVWQVAELTGATQQKRPVIFECVGAPGVIDDIVASAPLYSRVVVVGVCMEPDRLRPSIAINKEIDLRFVLGYDPAEFRQALHLLAEGKVRAEKIVTGAVGLDGVAQAFDTLGRADTHAKVLVDPRAAGGLHEVGS